MRFSPSPIRGGKVTRSYGITPHRRTRRRPAPLTDPRAALRGSSRLRPLQVRYRRWKEQNGDVFDQFRDLVRQALASEQRFSIHCLAELLRWGFGIDGREDKPRVRLTNSYVAYVVRDLIREMPALTKLVKTRRLRRERRG